ncbi:MAG: hypothetical protein JOZ84_08475 [Methylobacteriaceae bacterium]|nr:hypothetical protein [Methylobacteriaceae bacterium]
MSDNDLIRRADDALEAARDIRDERKQLLEAFDESRGKLAKIVQEGRAPGERSAPAFGLRSWLWPASS